MRKFLISACGVMGMVGASLACADIAVIVSKQTPLTRLEITQVKMVFMGKIGTFPDGSKAIPVDMPKSPVRTVFYQRVAGKTQLQMATYWSRMMFTGAGMPPQQAESAAEVLARVAADARLVGYVDARNVDDSVNVVQMIAE